MDPEDERALEQFMNHDKPVARTLAEIIKDKLTEKKTELQSQFSGKTRVMNKIYKINV